MYFTSILAQAAFDALEKTFPATVKDDPFLSDVVQSIIDKPSFDVAVNDLNTKHLASMSLKQWFTVIHQNTAAFLSQKSVTK